MKKIISVCVLFALLPFLWKGFDANCFAQKVLKDTMIHVVKSFQPTIADAYKINEAPVVKDSVPPIEKMAYSIQPKKIFTPFTVEPLNPATMVGEPLTKLYSTLVKLGYGNYNSPYGELFWNNLRSKDFSYGAHLNHFSSSATPEGYGYSGFSDNQVELYGKKFLRKQTLSGNLDYNRNMIHDYGYDASMFPSISKDSTRHIYTRIGGDIALQSHYTDSVHANYFVKMKYYNLSDNLKATEDNFHLEADFSSYYQKQLVHLPFALDYYSNKFDTLKSTSSIIGLNPYINASGKKWKTSIGMNIAVDAQQNNNSRFLFYPQIDFNYNVVENIIIPYAGVTGGLKRNSLMALSAENPFITPNPDMRNTDTRHELYIGIRGSISRTVSYNARTSIGKINDAMFFVNDYSSVLRNFNTVYDTVTLWNTHGELQYQFTEKLKFIVKGDYNQYSMTNEAEPWNTPVWKGTLSANYNLKNKIVVTADVFVFGERYTQDSISSKTVTGTVITKLKPIVDANLGLEYRYSKKLSAFLRFNNLGFNRYYYWNNYPTYKFNFLAGVSMVF